MSKRRLSMDAMKTFLLRIPISMNEELDQIIGEIYGTKSQFIRQSITRNLDVVRNVEMPLLRGYHQETTLRLLKVVDSVSKKP
jgi:metal-responsive CopG/Arc/MetJ family transcriptional regulator